MDRARKKPIYTTLVIDVEGLKSKATELGTEEGISSSFPTTHSSSTPVIFMETKGEDDQPTLTKATIFAIGHIAKVIDL